MPTRFWSILWIACILLAVGFAAITWMQYGLGAPVFVTLAILLVVTALTSFVPRVRDVLASPLRFLRARPLLYWLLLLVVITLWIARWLVAYQPTNGWPISAIEWSYFFVGLWALLYLFAYDMTSVQARSMAQKLASSRWTGILITLTTILGIFFLAEAYLR